MDVNRILAACMAVAATLLATIGNAPIPTDYRDGVGWALGGIVAGLGTYLGPQVADAVKAALKGKEPI